MDKKERIWNWTYCMVTIFFGVIYFLSIMKCIDIIEVSAFNIIFLIIVPMLFIIRAIHKLAYMIDYTIEKGESKDEPYRKIK